MTKSDSRAALVWAAMIVVYVVWGSTYFAIRVAVQTMPPLLMAGARFLVAGLLLCAWRLPLALRSGAAPTRDQWRRALVIGAALMLGGNGALSIAETTVPSGLAALIGCVVPLWMAIFDRLFFKRAISRQTVVGLALGFFGVGLLVGGPGGGAVSWIGAAILIVGSIAWAAGSLYSRSARLPDDAFLSTGMQMLTGGLCLLLAGIVAGEERHLHLAAIAPAAWWAVLYLMLFGGIGGFGAYLWVLRNAPTSFVSTYAYVNPVVAVILGAVGLHEPVTARIVGAGAVILLSVALIVSANRTTARAPTAARTPEPLESPQIVR